MVGPGKPRSTVSWRGSKGSQNAMLRYHRTLGQSLTRTRTYAEVETAMFDETEVIWRHLSGIDPNTRDEFRMTGEVVDYWFDRWSTELGPDEAELVNGVRQIDQQIRSVADTV